MAAHTRRSQPVLLVLPWLVDRAKFHAALLGLLSFLISSLTVLPRCLHGDGFRLCVTLASPWRRLAVLVCLLLAVDFFPKVSSVPHISELGYVEMEDKGNAHPTQASTRSSSRSTAGKRKRNDDDSLPKQPVASESKRRRRGEATTAVPTADTDQPAPSSQDKPLQESTSAAAAGAEAQSARPEEAGVLPVTESTAGHIFTGTGSEDGQAPIGGLLPLPSFLHEGMPVLPGGLFGPDTGLVEGVAADDGPSREGRLPRQATNEQDAIKLAGSAVNIGKSRLAMMVHRYG